MTVRGEPSSRESQQVPRWLFASAVVLVVAPMLALMVLAQPSGDDFCRARLAPLWPDIELWHPATSTPQYVWDTWKYWAGRWVSHAIEAAVLSRVELTTGYVWILVPNVVFLGLTLWLIARQLLTDRCLCLGVALGWLMLILSRSPGLGDGLFWFTGAIEYTVAPCLAALVLTLVLAAERWPRRLAWPAVVLGGVAVAGAHELAGIAYLAGLLVVALARRGEHRRTSWLWLAVAAAIVGLAINAGAPGNAFRSQHYAAPNLTLAFWNTRNVMLPRMATWGLDVPLLAGSVALYHSERFRHALRDFTMPDWRWLAGATVAVPVLLYSLAAYALSSDPNTRVLHALYLMFLFGWFMTLAAYTSQRGLVEATQSGMRQVALVVFLAAVVATGNVVTSVFDLRNRAGAWHMSMDRRFELLRQAPKGSRLVLDRVPQPPALFYARELESDERGFRNVCLARYFGVGAITVPRP